MEWYWWLLLIVVIIFILETTGRKQHVVEDEVYNTEDTVSEIEETTPVEPELKYINKLLENVELKAIYGNGYLLPDDIGRFLYAERFNRNFTDEALIYNTTYLRGFTTNDRSYTALMGTVIPQGEYKGETPSVYYYIIDADNKDVLLQSLDEVYKMFEMNIEVK